MRPADLPKRFAHGTRASYVTGCRCAPCRESNRLYYHQRRRMPWNGLVDAAPARAHLAALSAQGVGFRAVGDACDVARSVLAAVRSGKKRQIRAETERRILATDAGAAADHAVLVALVSAEDETGAIRAVCEDWPEGKPGSREWRFVTRKPDDFLPGDRFPLEPWMEKRVSAEEKERRHG